MVAAQEELKDNKSLKTSKKELLLMKKNENHTYDYEKIRRTII